MASSKKKQQANGEENENDERDTTKNIPPKKNHKTSKEKTPIDLPKRKKRGRPPKKKNDADTSCDNEEEEEEEVVDDNFEPMLKKRRARTPKKYLYEEDDDDNDDDNNNNKDDNDGGYYCPSTGNHIEKSSRTSRSRTPSLRMLENMATEARKVEERKKEKSRSKRKYTQRKKNNDNNINTTTTCKKVLAKKSNIVGPGSEDDSIEDEEINFNDIYCCMCLCSVDYSDPAAFDLEGKTAKPTNTTPESNEKEDTAETDNIAQTSKKEAANAAEKINETETDHKINEQSTVKEAPNDLATNEIMAENEISGKETKIENVTENIAGKDKKQDVPKDTEAAAEGDLTPEKEKTNEAATGNKNKDKKDVAPSPLLPASLYDSQNAILLCDAPGCNRAYHQRCHFVPVFVIPRGDWHCLICQYKKHTMLNPAIQQHQEQLQKTTTGKGVQNKKGRPSRAKPSPAKILQELLFDAEAQQIAHKRERPTMSPTELNCIFRVKKVEEAKRQKELSRAKNAPKPSNLESLRIEPKQNPTGINGQKSFPFAHGTNVPNQNTPQTATDNNYSNLLNGKLTTGNVVKSQPDEDAIMNQTNSQKATSASGDYLFNTQHSQDGKSKYCTNDTNIIVTNSKHQGTPIKPTEIVSELGYHVSSEKKKELTKNEKKSAVSAPLTSSSQQQQHHQQQQHQQELEKRFEAETKIFKSALLRTELTVRMKSTIDINLSRLRQAENTLRTYTETERARKSLVANYQIHGRLPQEFMQSMVRATKSKLQIRTILQNLNNVIQNRNEVGDLLQLLIQNNNKKKNKNNFGSKNHETGDEKMTNDDEDDDVVAAGELTSTTDWSKFSSVWFDDDIENRRKEPRFALDQDQEEEEKETKLKKTEEKKGTGDETKQGDNKNVKTPSLTPDDDAIASLSESTSTSLEKKRTDHYTSDEMNDVYCTVCFSGKATPENDILLCDGAGCFRAFHMQCVIPHVTHQMLDEDVDGTWFCPLCTALANWIFYVQKEYMGDEWEEHLKRKEIKEKIVDKVPEGLDNGGGFNGQKENRSESSSWEEAGDVFEGAEWEHAVALKWKEGRKDTETENLLRSLLGLPEKSGEDDEITDSQLNFDNLDDNDDDDSNEDEDFSVEDKKKKPKDDEVEGEEDISISDDYSTTSDEVSSVEWQIGKSELNKLSSESSDNESSEEEEEENDSDNDNDNDNMDSDKKDNKDQQKKSSTKRGVRRRKTRSAAKDAAERLAKRAQMTNSGTKPAFYDTDRSMTPPPDIGALDESNILRGKRNRTKVDYRRLNDAMFGDVSTENAAELLEHLDDQVEYQYTPVETSPGRRRRAKSRKQDVDTDDENEEDDASPKNKKETPTEKSQGGNNDDKKDEKDEDEEKEAAKKPKNKRVQTKKDSDETSPRPRRKRGRPSSAKNNLQDTIDANNEDNKSPPKRKRSQPSAKRNAEEKPMSESNDGHIPLNSEENQETGLKKRRGRPPKKTSRAS